MNTRAVCGGNVGVIIANHPGIRAFAADGLQNSEHRLGVGL